MKKVLLMLPILAPILALINTFLIILTNTPWNFILKDQLHRALSYQFFHTTPIYFNYWLIYLTIAFVFSVILAATKKYSVKQAVLAISLNIVAFIIVFVSLAKMM